MRTKKDEFKQLKRVVKSRRREEFQKLRTEISRIENEITVKKQEINRIEEERRAAQDPAERLEHEWRKLEAKQERDRLVAELRAVKNKEQAANIRNKRKKKTIQQEIFLLKRERSVTRERQAGSKETGTLPDFLIIGEKKCGTSYLYHLLGRHPLVEPAAKKELHFFDAHFDLGVEWYRRCFPAPRWEDGRRTITGEATPYMSNLLSAERIAGVDPEARLIALLRNPVDRAYSDYQMRTRKGRELLTFEEAIGVAEQTPLPGEESEAHARLGDARRGYLSRGVYVDQLLRWMEFFPREQLLVLKSEDFFENPQQTLKRVLTFLDLPEWNPEVSGLERKRNAGEYEEEMDPATRRCLQEYFEPHNQRLYDFLGTDFGW